MPQVLFFLGTILHTGKKKSNLQKRRNDKNFIISPFLIKDTIQKFNSVPAQHRPAGKSFQNYGWSVQYSRAA